MILCLESSLLGGYLSNEIPGLVTGLLHVAGRAQPVRVELEGNFLQDIAGCRVDFHNPCPEADPDLIDRLLPIQTGHSGIMTGSYRVDRLPRRRRRGKAPSDHGTTVIQDPPGLKNLVFFEWFNENSQRVLIQSWHLQLRVSPPRWHLSREEESRLLRENRARRRAFLLDRAKKRPQTPPPPASDDPFSDPEKVDPSSFDHETDPFEKSPPDPRPRSNRKNPGKKTEAPLPDPFQRAEALGSELRRFEYLLFHQDNVGSKPAILRLLTTVADLAAHLNHALRQFVTNQKREFEFLVVDLEQSLPLFGAALNAIEEMTQDEPEAKNNRWLKEIQKSLLAIELRMRELLSLMR